ncbi:MAG: hypothetical protein M1820_003642 [Bogoriella megaspora]|nr:MAG: hypothetical protein M1820_003642 [Bogoriella megaspora]
MSTKTESVKPDEVLEVLDKRSGKSYKVPIVGNTIRATDFKAIQVFDDKSDARDRTGRGLRIYDPGYRNTCVQETSVSSIDGERGTIHYRGHSIDDLYAHHDFDDVAFLLIWNRFPSVEERTVFRSTFASAIQPPPLVSNVVSAYPHDASAYAIWLAALSAWAGSDPKSIPIMMGKVLSLGDMSRADYEIIRTIGAMAGSISLTYCHRQKKTLGKSNASFSLVQNLISMMGLNVAENSRKLEKTTNCLNKVFILMAEHGMTNSTSCFLHAASSLADPLSSMVAGAASSSGPLHAGAIDMAYKCFEKIGTRKNVPQLIGKVKAGKERLFGYGHRMYKTDDPRAVYYRAMVDDLTSDPDFAENALVDVALEIDRIAREDQYFVSRRLRVNADMFASLIYTALGFEPCMVMLLAAFGRTSGMMAHWREMMSKRPQIWRPQDLYVSEKRKTDEKPRAKL